MAVSNDELADLLAQIANAQATIGENRYKVRAYERAARALRESDSDVAALYAESGETGIKDIGGIGEGIAGVLSEYLEQGRSRLLDDLRAEIEPGALFARVPGIGEQLASRIVAELDVSTLEELEEAAHDGRLERVEGVGSQRVQAVQDHLAQLFRRRSSSSGDSQGGDNGSAGEAPSDELLLEIDREYRARAEAGELKRIAPRRFNPDDVAWLPILETARDGWEFTALYSNTARAHEEGKTDDWVVIYWERNGTEGQNTVVTAERGARAGERLVAR